MTKTRFILKKIIRRNRINFLFTALSCLFIGIIIYLLAPSYYVAETQILIKNNSDFTALSAYICDQRIFHETLLQTTTEHEIQTDREMTEYDNWVKNIDCQSQAKDQVLKIILKGKNKAQVLNILETMPTALQVFNEDYTQQENLKFIIIEEPEALIKFLKPHLLLYIIISLLTAVVIIIAFIGYTLYRNLQKSKRRYLKYKKRLKSRRGRRRISGILESPKKRQKKRKNNNTENEVKEKLNRLIRGEDILSSLKKKKNIVGKK